MNNANINLVKVAVLDANTLQRLSRQTFIESYSLGNTSENVQDYIESSFNELKLIEEINNRYSQFYFAILNSTPIGYIKINFAQSQTDLKDSKSLEIERIYVLKEFQGRNIGQMLIEEAYKIARQTNLDYVWLGVWERNSRGIKFYERNEFTQFANHSFKFGSEVQTDVLMKRLI